MRRFLSIVAAALAAAPLAAQAPGAGPHSMPGKAPGRNFGGDHRRYQPLPPKPPAGKNAALDGALNLAMGMPAEAGKDPKAYLLAPPQLAGNWKN